MVLSCCRRGSGTVTMPTLGSMVQNCGAGMASSVMVSREGRQGSCLLWGSEHAQQGAADGGGGQDAAPGAPAASPYMPDMVLVVLLLQTSLLLLLLLMLVVMMLLYTTHWEVGGCCLAILNDGVKQRGLQHTHTTAVSEYYRQIPDADCTQLLLRLPLHCWGCSCSSCLPWWCCCCGCGCAGGSASVLQASLVASSVETVPAYTSTAAWDVGHAPSPHWAAPQCLPAVS